MSARTVELEITRLNARVSALEAALHRRSEQLRRLQQLLPVELLGLVEQAMADLPAGDPEAFDVEGWQETHALLPASVEALMGALWSATAGPPEAHRER